MKYRMIVAGCCWLAQASAAFAQGWITLNNASLYPAFLQNAKDGSTVPVPTSVSLVYGAFVNGVLVSSQLGWSSTVTPGIIEAPRPYPIFGFSGGETVSMQIRGWAAEYGRDWEAARAAGAAFGETDIRPVTLAFGDPATVIWQMSTSSHPARFRPLIVVSGGLAIRDITVAEGSNGVAQAVFQVTLGGACPDTVTVDFATQDGTAVAGQDYEPVSGTLEFPPGVTSRSISVQLKPDAAPEADETFSVVLSRAVNAGIRKATGLATITEARVAEIRLDTALVVHTVAGRHYSLERSADFVTWLPVSGAEDFVGIGGPMTVYDKGTGCAGVHYYRTRLLSP